MRYGYAIGRVHYDPALFAAISLLVASYAFGMELLVSNNNDSGAGSLRQAIIDNNTLGGGNTIIFSNIVTGTITLTSGELPISRIVSILGPGPKNLAVDGNGVSRVFHVTVPSDGAALISGLTITNGVATNSPPYSGGGIWNDHATLIVDNCTLSGNSANTFGGGAIYNDGSLSNGASLFIYSCTFSGNFSGTSGGAIANYGYQGAAGLVLRNSTFNDNRALSTGGAIYSDGFEGNVLVSVSSSTFSSNSATSPTDGNGGAIYNHGLFGTATLFVNGSTFSGNSGGSGGGAIYNNSPTGNATLEIGDTILRAGASGGTITNDLGKVTSRGYNLCSDTASGLLTNSTDKLHVDPLLGPLRDNGGPTFTHALLPGSPAIDQGRRDLFPVYPLEIMTADQRGAPRPFEFSSIINAPGGDGSDIGSFELGRPTLNIQQAGSSAVLSWPSYYGVFTLQSSTNVASSNSWITADGSAAIVGNEFRQTNGPISGNRFFRLRGN